MTSLSIICVALVVALTIEKLANARETRLREDAWRLERVALLNRIQSPEIAVADSIERPERKPVPVVGVDDDAAYAEAREARLNGTV